MSNEKTRALTATKVIELLQKERERQGMSMNELAQKCGLSQSSISLIERGLRVPNLDTLLRIADVLDLNLGKIIQKALVLSSMSPAR